MYHFYSISMLGVSIKDFKGRHVRELAKYLDEGSVGVNDWTSLLNEIPKELSIPIDEIKNKYVGGSDANRFLETLKSSQPNVTVKHFKETSEDLGRGDIAKLLSTISPETLLCKVEEATKRELALLLDVRGIEAIRNWRYFAEEYNLHEDDINAHVRKDGSPTVDVFKSVTSRDNGYTAYDLRSILVSISRPDVVKYLDGVVVEILKQKGELLNVFANRRETGLL